MNGRWPADLSPRNVVLLGVFLAALLLAPRLVNDYLLTVLIVILYSAYTGQAWNIMMGFAGQLSLGHAIYAGLGGYVAAVLFTRYGVGPWLGFLAAMPVCAACGAVIGFLAFRFGVSGVYFAILTIAFAEFARIGFDHLDFVNASAGLFLPVKQYAHNDLWRLRGSPAMFYYVILAAALAAFVLSRLLLRSRIGYFWLAIREDEAGGTRRRHRYLPLQNVRGDDLGGGHLVRRRVLRVLLQQSVSRAGVQYFPLDRNDPRPDHRRHRHAVRADPRRLRAHRACRIRALRRWPRSASICPAPSRFSMAYVCCSSSWRCRKAFGHGWRAGSASGSATDERAARRSTVSASASAASSPSMPSASTCPRA